MCWKCQEKASAQREGREPDYEKAFADLLDSAIGALGQQLSQEAEQAGSIGEAQGSSETSVELEQEKANVNLTNAHTINELSQAAERLHEIGATDSVQEILKLISVLTDTGAPAAAQPTRNPIPGEATGDDVMDDLPPELREFIQSLGGSGITATIHRFPKVFTRYLYTF